MLRVLLVCTGNTCRSPLAAAFFNRAMRRIAPGLAEAVSAGVAAMEGEPASTGTRAVAAEAGLDLETHRSRALTAKDVEAADLVLTMTAAHRERVLQVLPQAGGKVHVLAEYAGEQGDVEDPIGGDMARYRAVAARLERLTEQAARRLAEKTGRGELSVVALGWDHAGRVLREAVAQAVRARGYQVVELGSAGEVQDDDYPDFALRVAREVAAGRARFGVLMCGTGIGMCMAANKVRGVRAALCHDPYSARMARAHNDANVLTMGGRIVGPGLAAEVVQAFLGAQFEGGRHARRVDQIVLAEQPQEPVAGPGPEGGGRPSERL